MKDIAQPVRFKEMLTPWVLTLFCSLVATLGNLLVILQKNCERKKENRGYVYRVRELPNSIYTYFCEIYVSYIC